MMERAPLRRPMMFKRFDSAACDSGVLLASPVRAGMRGRIWMIDTTGQAEALIKANKLRLPDLDAMGPRETLGAKGRDRMVR